jgi:2,4-dienoyl-CoA reductase-like NADH-dependent reductase (Old Yellow Enzyme family)
MTLGIIMPRMTNIASPLVLRSGSTLPNRIAKAAMSEVLADPATGAPNDALFRLYERWGKSGAGLLITGHVIVDRGGLGEPGNVVVTDDRHLALLRQWADVAQSGGARLWMQINHAGRQAPKRTVRQPVAPSAVAMKGFMGAFARPRALTDDEIRGLIARFATTAAIAKDAGFAGVEIHAAHGYLISQFLSPRTNQRDDAWGGDAARRSRFLIEIVRAVRAATGQNFGLGVKLNSADFQRGGFTIEESMDVARALDDAGVDVLEVSGGTYEQPAMAGDAGGKRESTRAREAYFLDYARRIRAVTSMPLMLTGGMRSRAVMDDAIASGAVDVVGIARPMTYAPELPAGLLDGSIAAAPHVDVKSRIRLVENALQVFWFVQQIHRMSRGLEPDLALGRWSALWRGMRSTLFPAGRKSRHAAGAIAPSREEIAA